MSAETPERRAQPIAWWFAPAVAFGLAIVVSVVFQQTVSRDSFAPPGIALLAFVASGPLAWLDQTGRREFGAIARAVVWIVAASSLVIAVVLLPVGGW
ncbi:hypothetical protein QSJ19_25975 [Gordonia sp. ABSL11-1]|uniref:hypothetical protein n=1 Tax=Gordonia sp. ABSL11-1 TaxID=3053924 RepID=UPI0025744A88|nr:hypothetical protein [Gordonia sp. ABSL11-1]MDL9948965.1 hypothetical protein [Gordonia sp. ABSL11-1]